MNCTVGIYHTADSPASLGHTQLFGIAIILDVVVVVVRGGDTPCRPSCYKPPVDKTLYQDSLPTFSACCVTTPTLEPHEMASH